MAITHTYTFNWNNGGTPITDTYAVTHATPGELNADVSVAATTTQSEGSISFTVAKLQSIRIASTGDVTLNTNSATGAGGDSFALKAGLPFEWITGSGITCPFTTTVTGFWFVNAPAVAITVKVRTLVNIA